MKFEITQELAQEIVNYLSTCPYGQVHRIVHKLQTELVQIPEKKDEAQPTA